ncbi:hypothetical protein CYV19_15390 [Natronobacterium gregoryi SP2]|uniref:Uncharacterized protein n=1 Tax=Natronobacterium gregoryi (strain ATCC 43098 / DSM 3393 / CCM 3738 / CIP 104747 / IAM 13177 / JCM 8860 / NBRC 102187 / NCIMB 2189 / SP2) TaxID=797304 RepID=A0A2J4JBR4_NATGS|nr:hypothetical protein CYV19_15390 [Natronobacterium gregoryi SP2]
MTAIVTMLATAVGTLALAVGVGALEPAVVAAVAGCLLTATVTATSRRTPGGRAAGSVLVVFVAVAVTGAIGFAAVHGPVGASAIFRVGVVLSVVLASFGATATLTGAVGDGAVRSAIPVAVVTAVPIAAATAASAGPVRSGRATVTDVAWTSNGRLAVEALLSPDATGVGVVTFVALFVALLWSVAFVLPRLPIPQLLSRQRQKPARQRVRRIASLTRVLGLLALLVGTAATAVLLVPDAVGIPPLESVIPILESALVPIATAPAVRISAIGTLATLWLLWVLSKAPGVRRLRYGALVNWGPTVTIGCLVAALVVVGYPTAFETWIRPTLGAMASDGAFVVPGLGTVPLADGLEVVSPPAGVVFAGVAVVFLVGTVVAVLVGLWLTGLVRLLPTRGAPGSLVAGALVAGSIFAAADGASAFIVCTAVAAAIVSWDTAVYGVTITEELGRDANARLPTLAHATGAVLVGIVGITLALVLPRLLETIAVRTGITVAVSLTVALLAILVALKRRAKTN